MKIVRTQSWGFSAVLTLKIGLTLNVIVPAHARPGSKLPIVVVCTRDDIQSVVLIEITRSVVDLWRQDACYAFDLSFSLT